MKSFFRCLIQLFESPKRRNQPVAERIQPVVERIQPVVAPIQPVVASDRSRRQGQAILVNREPSSYWRERGWQKEGGTYRGIFQTRFGKWPGYATISPSGRVEIFIQRPPPALKQHPHWACFRQLKGGWFFVHPISEIPDLSAAILSIEKTINQAYEGKT